MTARRLRGEASQGGFVRDSALAIAGSVGTTFLSGVATIVIARELGPTGRGDWAAVLSLATLVAIFVGLGLPNAAGYGAGKLQGEDRRRLVDAAIRGSAALAPFAAAIYLAIGLFSTQGRLHWPVFVGGAVIAALVVMQNVMQQLVLVGARLSWFVLSQTVSAAAALLTVIVLAVAGELTLETVVLVYACRTLANAAIAASGLARAGAIGRPAAVRHRDAWRALTPYLGYAVMTFLTLSLTQLVQRVDVLLVAGLRSSHAAGLYAVAVQLLELLVVIPGGLGFLLFRRGARSSSGHWNDALRAMRWTLVVQLVASSFLFIAAPTVVSVIFGPRYSGSVVAVRWLMPGAVMLGLQTVASNYIASRGRPRSVVVAWAAGASVGVGLNVALIPRYGVAGAAAVSSLAYAVVFALHVIALREVRAKDVLAQNRQQSGPGA